jgi:hypothetical protein
MKAEWINSDEAAEQESEIEALKEIFIVCFKLFSNLNRYFPYFVP